ncbi:MAG: Y4yA family PLP-dependent enzyme [Cyclobacteriaceae bacterium]
MSTQKRKQSSNIHPALSPIVHPWIRTFIESVEFSELINEFGSPLNIHCLEPFLENQQEFEAVFKAQNVKHQIYFARKANKCKTLVEAAKKQKMGVDTASLQELKDCLDVGIDPATVVLTAAIKTEPMLTLAAKNGVTIILDNWDECMLLHQIAENLDLKPIVGFRIGGFSFRKETLSTRFGFGLEDAFGIMTRHLGAGNKFHRFHFTTLHFHLNGYSIPQRAAALIQTIRLSDRLKSNNISCQKIDIGGGILVNYLTDQEEWDLFYKELRSAILMKRDPVTFENDPLGMVKIENEIYGSMQVYPYFNTVHKGQFLKAILDSTFDANDTLAQALKKRNITLAIEPGRSLLDQVGITIARVVFRKKNQQQDWFIGLEMNRTQMKSSSADFLLDPIFIPTQAGRADAPCDAYLVGSYCLEQELILKRKIRLKTLPLPGDIFCFINTAGYMMHFYESQAHLFDLAKNIFVHRRHDGWHINADAY